MYKDEAIQQQYSSLYAKQKKRIEAFWALTFKHEQLHALNEARLRPTLPEGARFDQLPTEIQLLYVMSELITTLNDGDLAQDYLNSLLKGRGLPSRFDSDCKRWARIKTDAIVQAYDEEIAQASAVIDGATRLVRDEAYAAIKAVGLDLALWALEQARFDTDNGVSKEAAIAKTACSLTEETREQLKKLVWQLSDFRIGRKNALTVKQMCRALFQQHDEHTLKHKGLGVLAAEKVRRIVGARQSFILVSSVCCILVASLLLLAGCNVTAAGFFFAAALIPAFYFAKRFFSLKAVGVTFGWREALFAELSYMALGLSAAGLMITKGTVSVLLINQVAYTLMATFFSSFMTGVQITQAATVLVTANTALMLSTTLAGFWIVPAMFVTKALWHKHQAKSLMVGAVNLLGLSIFLASGWAPFGLAVLTFAVVMTMSAWVSIRYNHTGEALITANMLSTVFAVAASLSLLPPIGFLPLGLTVLATVCVLARTCYVRKYITTQEMDVDEDRFTDWLARTKNTPSQLTSHVVFHQRPRSAKAYEEKQRPRKP